MQTHVTTEFLKSQELSENFPRRFFKKVKITDGCWIWTGSLTRRRYGKIFQGVGQNHHIESHVASWILHFGAIPEGMEVCHDCPGGDNPSCVNPAHLWLGTHNENMQDYIRKGGTFPHEIQSGEKHYLAKLTWKIVDEMRKSFRSGSSTFRELADKYGIRYQHAWLVIRGQSWFERNHP